MTASNFKKDMSEEEYLKRHLGDIDDSKVDDNPISGFNPTVNASKSSDLTFFNFDVKDLPCGRYYPTGTIVMVRPAQVKEIQAYSMVDDNNFYDIVEKMNDIIQSCVRLKMPDGKIVSYLDVKDQDRLFLVFLIRELTFQQGNSLAVNSRCSCGTDMQIEMCRKNFVFHEFDEKLDKYFDNSTKTFRFRVQNNKEYELSPPCIGIQKSFTLSGRSSITQEGIKAKLSEFERIDDISFQFLNAAVGKMTFGLKELKSNCSSCGLEVRSEMSFPNGASGIFIIQDAFEAYIKE